MENKFKNGNIIKHKASNENMVVLDDDTGYHGEVLCRYFNKKDGQYCQKSNRRQAKSLSPEGGKWH